ncbi:Nucleotide-sensitive chloride conductance regulator [Ostertagia ostertagi]
MADVLAKLSALSDRFKGEPMTSVQADMMLNLIPRELLEKILSDSGGSLAEFQDVAIDILGTLLPSCSNDTLEKHYSLAPLLLHRLRTSEGMDSLNEISGCILSLYKLGSHNQEKYLHDTADVLSSYCVNNSQDFPFTCILHRLTECIANLRSSSENYGLYALGGKWFAPDLSLLLLLVHIVVVQVRMCLDKPDTINSQSLAVCYHILEMAIECVEESSLLDDSMATRLAATVREAAFYSIEYWVEAKEQEEHLNESTNEPSEGVRLSQPQVVAYLDGECAGEGSQVTWICRSSGLGFSLTYPSIILHAVSTDLSTFPHECIYVLVDASKSERRRRPAIPFFTAADSHNAQDLKLADEELNDDDNASEDDEEEGKNVVIRFVPSDLSVLQQIYTEMCNCQELNPDENDDFSDEDDGEMVVAEGDDGLLSGDGWYTAENIGSGEHVELSEEGRANLHRMTNHARDGCGDHDDAEENGDNEMDEQ